MTSAYPWRSEAAHEEYRALLTKRAEAWPILVENAYIDTPTARTFVRISGDESNPPLFLFHGARGNSLTWVPNIEALAAEYRTYAVDSIHDYGLSASRTHNGKRENLLIWLDEIIEALAPDGPVNLAGLSYGGWLVSQYALRHPERARRLVMMAPAATVLPVSLSLILHALPSVLPGPVFRTRFYDWLLADLAHSGPDGRAFIDQVIADWLVAERCFQRLPLVNATVLSDAEWAGLRVPALFLVGEHEKTYSPTQAIARLNQVAPQIKTDLINDAGHDLWIVQAECVTQTILEFLRDR